MHKNPALLVLWEWCWQLFLSIHGLISRQVLVFFGFFLHIFDWWWHMLALNWLDLRLSWADILSICLYNSPICIRIGIRSARVSFELTCRIWRILCDYEMLDEQELVEEASLHVFKGYGCGRCIEELCLQCRRYMNV